jgi:hypothetical protein
LTVHRHRLDPVSLLGGLACITFAVAALASELDVRDLDRGLLVPAVLIVVAVLLVAGIRPRTRPSDEVAQRAPSESGG